MLKNIFILSMIILANLACKSPASLTVDEFCTEERTGKVIKIYSNNSTPNPNLSQIFQNTQVSCKSDKIKTCTGKFLGELAELIDTESLTSISGSDDCATGLIFWVNLVKSQAGIP